MPKVVKWRYIKIPLEMLLYVCLFAGGLIFSWETVQEYLKGSTSHYSTMEPITPNDLPTLSICWEWLYERDIYGKHFFMDSKHQNESETVTLIENEGVKVSPGLELHLSELHHRCSKRQNVSGDHWDLMNCTNVLRLPLSGMGERQWICSNLKCS